MKRNLIAAALAPSSLSGNAAASQWFVGEPSLRDLVSAWAGGGSDGGGGPGAGGKPGVHAAAGGGNLRHNGTALPWPI
jgi:hypothetical protein